MSKPGTQYSLFESVEAIPVEAARADQATERRFSDYVVYVDESGDHSLASVDKDYPVFVKGGPYKHAYARGNGKFDAYWMAGYGTGRLAMDVNATYPPANVDGYAIHDPIWARALAMKQNGTTVVVAAVDVVGSYCSQLPVTVAWIAFEGLPTAFRYEPVWPR